MAALLRPSLSLCLGLELCRPLHEMATKALQSLIQTVKPHQVAPVSLRECDVCTTAWAEQCPMLVLACSTMFDQQMMRIITQQARQLPAGAHIVTTTKQLDAGMLGEQLVLVLSLDLPMSWGTATCFFYKRTTVPAHNIIYTT